MVHWEKYQEWFIEDFLYWVDWAFFFHSFLRNSIQNLLNFCQYREPLLYLKLKRSKFYNNSKCLDNARQSFEKGQVGVGRIKKKEEEVSQTLNLFI